MPSIPSFKSSTHTPVHPSTNAAYFIHLVLPSTHPSTHSSIHSSKHPSLHASINAAYFNHLVHPSILSSIYSSIHPFIYPSMHQIQSHFPCSICVYHHIVLLGISLTNIVDQEQGCITYA